MHWTCRRILRKTRQTMNRFNLFIVTFSILTSFCLVKALNASSAIFSKRDYTVMHLVDSTSRIADAFDLYNQKRFEL